MRIIWHQIEQNGHPTGLWAVMMAVLMAFMIGLPALVSAENRVAFVVGIGTYDNLPSHQQLKNPLNDAEGVSKKLADIGFQVVTAPNLTRSDFNARWQDVLNGLTEDDTFVLYFSGHGVQVDGQNYLLPRDLPYIEYGRQAQLTREAISLDQLLADLSTGNRRHPKRSVVILDACRDNPLIPQEFKSGSTRGGLAKPPEPNGIFVIYSAGSNKTALDRLSPSDPVKYSVFTRVLLPLMERKDLTIQTLSIELKEQVAKLAKGAQQPAYYDGILGQFCLPGCAAKTNKDTAGLTENLVVSVLPATKNEITGKDGAPMALIPAGEFWMGSPDGEGEANEHPRHQVYLDAYSMDKFEVSVSRYAEFMQSTGQRAPGDWDKVNLSKHSNLPVVGVNWQDAEAYCKWSGKRLPAEAEWEKAARGTDERTYPWGNEQPALDLPKILTWLFTMNVYDHLLSPVDSDEEGKSPYGLHHMAGNVTEWTADWYDEYFYAKSPQRNPAGPSSGTAKVVRSSSWKHIPSNLRCANRIKILPTKRFDNIGFRCAQDVPK